MIFSLPVSVMTGEPDCQNTWLPFPFTVMLLQDPNNVMTFAFPRTSTAFPLQVKVRVWSLSVMRIVPELGGGCVGNCGTVGVGSIGVEGSVGVKSTMTVGDGVNVKAGVTVVDKSQAGPAIKPVATSGPFTPTWTVPTVSAPESITLNSPL